MLAGEMTELGMVLCTVIVLSFMGCVTYLWHAGDFD